MTNTRIDLPLFILDQMNKSTTTKISLPHGMFLMKVFKYYNVDLNDEIKWTPKAISDEYNEKNLKQMGYELKNNQWTPKSSKKMEERSSSSKGKENLRSKNGWI